MAKPQQDTEEVVTAQQHTIQNNGTRHKHEKGIPY